MVINLIISAVFLYAAYALPIYFCWLVFIFLVPLFVMSPQLGFKQGFVWGILFYTLHLYPIAVLLYERAQGDYRMLLFPLLIVYMALHSGGWFFVAHKAQRYVGSIVWPVATLIYFKWMQGALFWVFDVCEGYPFAVPIIPLAEYPGFLMLLPWFGVYGLTALLIWAQWCVAEYSSKQKRRYAVGAVCCYAVFLIGFFFSDNEQVLPEYAQHLVYISPLRFDPKNSVHPLDCAQEIAYILQEGKEQYSRQACFVLPESAFPFVAYAHSYSLWQSILDDNKYELIIGLHKKAHLTTKNCCDQLDFCRIIQSYAKTHATLLTERTPYHLKGLKFFTHLFGGKTDRRKINENIYIQGTYSLLMRTLTYYFLPVLCSELFFNDFSSLPFKKVPILLLCNDIWFSTNQMKNLMFLYAKIYAIQQKRPIIYVSHTKGVLIPQTGKPVALCTIA